MSRISTEMFENSSPPVKATALIIRDMVRLCDAAETGVLETVQIAQRLSIALGELGVSEEDYDRAGEIVEEWCDEGANEPTTAFPDEAYL